MQRAATAVQPSTQALCRQIRELSAAAIRFVARDRGEALMQKWLDRRGVEAASENRLLAMMADAALLSADLMLSQPAASGTTAFDRLARSRAGDPSAQAAVAVLRQARFRLLRLEGPAQAPQVMVRDVLTDEVLRIAGAEMPALPAGTVLFARTAVLEDGLCCLPGAITPLDPPALAVARSHAAAAGARWAEAVYAHVVRHGTLDVAGLNRPADYFDSADNAKADPLSALAAAWAALDGGTPEGALLQRTRQCADLPTMLDALSAAAAARQARDQQMAAAFDRLLLVQMEAILRRERSGSGLLSLDEVGRVLEDAVARRRMSPAARTLFGDLRQRLSGAGGARPADDTALERLVQKIQGLRAKTVAHGCTEQEALAAAEKVAELLDRYGLSLGELDFRAQPCEGVGIQTDRRRLAPIDSCINAIAAFFDCRAWYEHTKGMPLRYVFFGLRGDVTAAQYLYEMVERAFETETDAFRAGPLYAQMAGERRSATNSFQIGLSRGICGKLDSMRAARAASRHSASGRDLVPVKAAMVDEELAKLGLDLRARTSRRPRVLTDAFAAGKAAGERFDFAPAITRAA